MKALQAIVTLRLPGEPPNRIWYHFLHVHKWLLAFPIIPFIWIWSGDGGALKLASQVAGGLLLMLPAVSFWIAVRKPVIVWALPADHATIRMYRRHMTIQTQGAQWTWSRADVVIQADGPQWRLGNAHVSMQVPDEQLTAKQQSRLQTWVAEGEKTHHTSTRVGRQLK